MKKTALIFPIFLAFPWVLMAAPAVELAPSITDADCANDAAQLMVRYSEIFDLGRDVNTIRFEDFKNTTPGSLNQEYAANLTLVHQWEISLGVNTTRLRVKFSSPFICEDLKIISIEDRGIDTSDPLYLCLNENPEVDALEAIRAEASQKHLDAMSKACEHVPYGTEKLKCQDDWHQTEEGKALFDKVKETQVAVAVAWGECYSRFPRDY